MNTGWEIWLPGTTGTIQPHPLPNLPGNPLARRPRLFPPPPMVLDRPGTIRFCVRNGRGHESLAFSVVGRLNHEDVYVGIRDLMGDLKLSLHPTWWRFAFTPKGAERYRPGGEDRLIHKWAPTHEMAPGWQHAATIAVPGHTVMPYVRNKKPKRGPIAYFPAPYSGYALRFDVLLGAPDREGLTFPAAVAEVGQMTLTGGRVVVVVAHEVPLKDDYWAMVQRSRSQLPEGLSEVPRPLSAWAWGTDTDGCPTLWHFGDPKTMHEPSPPLDRSVG